MYSPPPQIDRSRELPAADKSSATPKQMVKPSKMVLESDWKKVHYRKTFICTVARYTDVTAEDCDMGCPISLVQGRLIARKAPE